ncbi:MAG: peroxiredoxin [Nanoarchaeota archaeon]|jgi:peroxiredoxin Q/BCP|nr:peroxiredoxin [Nanoarchaeota archaeon]
MYSIELLNQKAPTRKGIDFKKNNYTIFFFYPRDNTPGCTIEAKEFTELLPEFKKLNTQVYGISKDSEESHSNFIEKHDLKINLISDEDLLLHQKFKVWKEKKLMGRKFMGTVRTTFLIDSNGRIEKVWETVKPKGHALAVLTTISEAMGRPLPKRLNTNK